MKITRQQIRKIIQEVLNESPRRFGDYSKKDSNSYRTVITMSPEGDSAIVDGIETYIDDVPQQLEILSGFSTPNICFIECNFSLISKAVTGSFKKT